MTMRPDPTFHASPKLAMEAPPENFAYTLPLADPEFAPSPGHRTENVRTCLSVPKLGGGPSSA